MEIITTAEERAGYLLERLRDAPMRRGALSPRARQLALEIAKVVEAEGVAASLAQRLGFQFAFKFHRRDLYDEAEWQAVGRIVCREASWLKRALRMGDQRIVAALPKVSAQQVIDFFDELTHVDRRIARTILHAALITSEPLITGRRYMMDDRLIARKLGAVDPTMARTVAAATFSAGAPLSKAMEMARRLARAGLRTRPSAGEAAL